MSKITLRLDLELDDDKRLTKIFDAMNDVVYTLESTYTVFHRVYYLKDLTPITLFEKDHFLGGPKKIVIVSDVDGAIGWGYNATNSCKLIAANWPEIFSTGDHTQYNAASVLERVGGTDGLATTTIRGIGEIIFSPSTTVEDGDKVEIWVVGDDDPEATPDEVE